MILPIVRPQIRDQILSYPISYGGTPIVVGHAADLYLPWDCRFAGWVLSSHPDDAPGSITLDVRVALPGTFPGGSASIVGSNPPAIAAGNYAESFALSDWDTDHVEGSMVSVWVTSTDGILTLATLALVAKRA